MIEVSIVGKEKLLIVGEIVLSRRKMASMRVKEEMDDLGLRLVRTSKSEYLSGPRPQNLGVVSGRLRRSINAFVNETVPDTFELSFGTNVEYARIHEFGGPVIRKGKIIFVMKSRPFLRSAWGDEVPAFQGRLEQILTDISGGITDVK